jgi:tryptophan-rich sensory protein
MSKSKKNKRLTNSNISSNINSSITSQNQILSTNQPNSKPTITSKSRFNYTKISLFVLFFVLINLVGGYGIVWLGVDIRTIYENLNKPFFAPATWVFGIAWAINNILVLIGNYMTLELPKSTTRDNLIKVQIVSWINYVIFQYLSFGSAILFGKLIPAMFFVPTFSMWILTVISMILAYKLDTQDYNEEFKVYTGKQISLWSKIAQFKSIFASFTSLISWLTIASLLGLYIWLNN